jgi:hypothetical protein
VKERDAEEEEEEELVVSLGMEMGMRGREKESRWDESFSMARRDSPDGKMRP